MGTKTKKQTLLASHYHNYTIQDEPFQTLDETYDVSDFYNDFIKIRKPVKLVNQNQFIKVKDFDVDHLQKTLHYEGDLQIEKKVAGGFGSNGKRLKMSLDDLMKEFKLGKDEYYLTTQYDEGDEESEEDEDEDEDEEDEEEEQENIATGIDVFSNNVDSHDNEDNVDDFDEGDFDHNHDSEDSFDFDNLQVDYEDENDGENDDEDEDALTVDGVTISKHEAIQRVNELLQPPLTNLATSSFPIIPPIFDKLIPQQINLWMGCISSTPSYTLDLKDTKTLGLGKFIPGDQPGTSSGLHHDHADNLYILVQGKKRFTIYSPVDAGKLATIGKIYKIFNSGIIDYQIDESAPKWKHIRDDGAIIEEIVYWLIDQEKKGQNNQDTINTYLKQIDEELKSRAKYHNLKAVDPPNFSQIPPALLHIDDFTNEDDKSSIIQFAKTYFPDFLQLKNYKIWLEPGEMLYLPAGWFHEVSSFGNGALDQLQNVHIALNYWFIPPNDETKVYSDDYWQQDWQKTKASLKLFKSGQVEP